MVGLRLTAGLGAVLIEVHDQSSRLPERQLPASGAEHGRGLVLVDALSLGRGTRPLPGNGKIVWCIAGDLPIPLSGSEPLDVPASGRFQGAAVNA